MAADKGTLRQRKTKDASNTSKKTSAKKSKKEPKNKGSFIGRVLTFLWADEDPSYLAFYRILWGLVMTFEIYRFIEKDFAKSIYNFYSNPYGWQCKYWMMEWVNLPASFEHFQLVLYFLFVCGLFITVGFLYRPAAFCFFIGICYLFFLESSSYLNHIYLTMVLCFITLCLPCNCCYSIDAWRKPERYSRKTVPKIILIFLKAAFFIVYAFAGVVKCNEDWLRAEPLRHWAAGKNTVYGDLLNYEISAYFLSYGGMIYDATVGLMILYNPTFYLGIAMTLFFHISNKLIFNIGIFPYMMIASTSLFFSPDWPRRIMHYLKATGKRYVPAVKPTKFKDVKAKKLTGKQKFFTFLMVVFVIVWIGFPLRHYALPGEVLWNELGHKYSWRMKLRDKDCSADVFGYNAEANTAFEVPLPNLLSRRQYPKVIDRPWMVAQLANWLGDLYSINDTRSEIYFHCDCQVNYRPRQPYSDPTIDLAAEPVWQSPYRWITELEPLPEEYYIQYPWNFKWWDFEWMKKTLFKNIAIQRDLDRKQRNEEVSHLRDKHFNAFREFIAEKHYNGNQSAVGDIPALLPAPAKVHDWGLPARYYRKRRTPKNKQKGIKSAKAA